MHSPLAFIAHGEDLVATADDDLYVLTSDRHHQWHVVSAPRGPHLSALPPFISAEAAKAWCQDDWMKR